MEQVDAVLPEVEQERGGAPDAGGVPGSLPTSLPPQRHNAAGCPGERQSLSQPIDRVSQPWALTSDPAAGRDPAPLPGKNLMTADKSGVL